MSPKLPLQTYWFGTGSPYIYMRGRNFDLAVGRPTAKPPNFSGCTAIKREGEYPTPSVTAASQDMTFITAFMSVEFHSYTIAKCMHLQAEKPHSGYLK